MQSQGMLTPVIPFQHYLGALGPIVAAIVITACTTGTSGVRQFGRRFANWRVGLHWYLIALFAPAALYVISAIGIGWYNGERVDFGLFGQSDEFPAVGLFGVWLIQTLTFGVCEEAGWRGFMLPHLQSKYGALSATIVLSVFWAFWHIPAFFYRPGYTSMGPAEIVGWYFSLLTGAILLTWLYNGSKGSILIVALFHGSIDVAFTAKAIDAGVMSTMGALIVVWAIIVILLTGPTHLSRAVRQQSHQTSY